MSEPERDGAPFRPHFFTNEPRRQSVTGTGERSQFFATNLRKPRQPVATDATEPLADPVARCDGRWFRLDAAARLRHEIKLWYPGGRAHA